MPSRRKPGPRAALVPLAVASLAVASLALVPSAAAAAPSLSMWVTHQDAVLTLEDTLPIRAGFNLTCGDPPPATTVVWLEPQSMQVNGQDAYNITFDRWRWTIPAGECGGTVRREVTGRFRFLLPMTPFWPVGVRLSAWGGDGTDAWVQGATDLQATPDATFRRPGFPSLVGASMTAGTAERVGDRIHQGLQWELANQGRGAFVASLAVDSMPDWMKVESLPATLESGPDAGQGARGNATMVVSMPASCPARAGTLTLAYSVRSPEPRSHAHAEAKAQGAVPCDPSVGRGTPAAGAAIPLAAVATAAAVLRLSGADARHKR